MQPDPTDVPTSARTDTSSVDFVLSMEASDHEDRVSSSSSNDQEQDQPQSQVVTPTTLVPTRIPMAGGDDGAVSAVPAGSNIPISFSVDINNPTHSTSYYRLYGSYYPGNSVGHLFTNGLHELGFPELLAQDVPRHRASLVTKNMYRMARSMVSGIPIRDGDRRTDRDFCVTIFDDMTSPQIFLEYCNRGVIYLPLALQPFTRILALHPMYDDAEEWGSFPLAPQGQRQRRNKILEAALFQRQVSFDEEDVAYLLRHMAHFCRLVEVSQASDVIQRLPQALAEQVDRHHHYLTTLGSGASHASSSLPSAAAAAPADKKATATQPPSAATVTWSLASASAPAAAVTAAVATADKSRRHDFESNYNQALKYIDENGELKLSRSARETTRLYAWLLGQRRRKNMSNDEREKINYLFKCYPKYREHRAWESFYQELVEYKESHGTFRISITDTDLKRNQLNNWLKHQRVLARKGQLAQSRKEALEEAGVDLNPRNLGKMQTNRTE